MKSIKKILSYLIAFTYLKVSLVIFYEYWTNGYPELWENVSLYISPIEFTNKELLVRNTA